MYQMFIRWSNQWKRTECS